MKPTLRQALHLQRENLRRMQQRRNVGPDKPKPNHPSGVLANALYGIVKQGNADFEALVQRAQEYEWWSDLGPVGPDAGPTETAARKLFTFVESITPKRIYNEDLGDWLEKVAALELAGASRWRCWLTIAAALAWTAINIVREVRAVWMGQKVGK